VGVCKEYHSKGDSGVKRTACGRGDQGKRRVRRSARAEDRRQLRGWSRCATSARRRAAEKGKARWREGWVAGMRRKHGVG